MASPAPPKQPDQKRGAPPGKGAQPTSAAVFLHAFDPAEGRSRRVHVLGFASRRRAKPRAFTLTFTAPPPPPRPPPPPAPPAPPSPMTLELMEPMQPSCAPSPATAPGSASPLQLSATEHADDGLHLDDLVALAFEAARARQTVVGTAQTPAASLQGACGPAARAGHHTRTPSLHTTPIEGIPERFLLSNNRAEPQRCGGLSAAPTSGRSTSGFGMTPIEGVPERQLKRPRLSALPRPPNLAGPSAGGFPQQEEQQSGLGEAERAVCSVLPSGTPVAPGPETAGPNPRAGPPDDITAADIAAAVYAAARTAMERLQPLLAAGTPLTGGPAPTVATTSHTSMSTSAGTSDSAVSNGTTPALVKMHNLAAAAADAVKRAAEAMGGPPSCCPGLRPPRPPSARSGSGRWVPDATAAGSSGQAAVAPAAAGNDGPTGEPEALPSLDGLIHRAKPGALLFPSRTPSPMGGVHWPLRAGGTAPPALTPGAGVRGAMVTPTLALPGTSGSAPSSSHGAPLEVEACAVQRLDSHDAAAAWPAGGDDRSDLGSDGGAADGGGEYSDQDGASASDGIAAGGQGGDAGDGPPLPSPANTEVAFADGEDQEALAMEVQALPDDPEPAARRRRSSGRGPAAAGRGLSREESAAASERQQSLSHGGEGERAAQRRQTESHAHERRLVVNRKSLAGIGLTMDEGGTRRSTRSRVRPLQYWRGEAKSYGRQHNTLPTVRAIKMRTPEPKWPRPTEPQEKAKRRARTKQAAQSAGASEDPRNE